MKKEIKVCKSKMESQTSLISDYTQQLEKYDKKFEETATRFQTMLMVRLLFLRTKIFISFVRQELPLGHKLSTLQYCHYGEHQLHTGLAELVGK